jgi:hypothetical protein
VHLQVATSVDSPSDSSKRKSGRRNFFLWAVYIVSFAVLIWFVADGYSYYSTAYTLRPHSPEYRILRPSGTRGLAFGYAGAAMMIVMLIYSIRKRTRLLGRNISLQTLLRFHIYLGIIGPLLIVLHTSFKVQGLVAVAFWSMVAVALSGYFGRYLYLQIPRNIHGTELTLNELDGLNSELTNKLRTRFQLDDSAVAKLEAITDQFISGFRGGAFRAVFLLLATDLFRFVSRRRFIHRIRIALPLPGREMREFSRLAFQRAHLQRRIALLAQVQQVFHYWHVIHKPFAIIMYLIMLVHIGVAVWTGYGWVW